MNKQMGLFVELRKWVWGLLSVAWLHNFCEQLIGVGIFGRVVQLL